MQFLSLRTVCRGKMFGSNLRARLLITLPASAFPSRADVFVCDKCGRDVTKRLHPRKGHVWTPMGPLRYVCRCGEKYLTAARECDHFSGRERKRRVQQTLLFGVVLSLMASIPGLQAYLFLHFIFDLHRGARIGGFGHYRLALRFNTSNILARRDCIDVAHQNRRRHCLRTKLNSPSRRTSRSDFVA